MIDANSCLILLIIAFCTSAISCWSCFNWGRSDKLLSIYEQELKRDILKLQKQMKGEE